MTESLRQLRARLAEQAMELAAIQNEPRARTLIIEKLAEVRQTTEQLMSGYHVCSQELEIFTRRKSARRR